MARHGEKQKAPPDRLPEGLRIFMAGWTGLEPAASGVTGRRYNQLNYHPIKQMKLIQDPVRAVNTPRAQKYAPPDGTEGGKHASNQDKPAFADPPERDPTCRTS